MQGIYKSLSVTLLFAFAITGTVIAFVLPPFQAPDEPAHWLTANNRYDDLLQSQPSYCSVGRALDGALHASEVPFHYSSKVPRGHFEKLDKAANACDSTKISYGNLLTYPGVVVARTLITSEDGNGLKAAHSYYMSRLFQGAMLVLVLARLIWLNRRDPRPGLLTLMAAVMAPIVLQQSFAVTSDLVANCFAVLLVACLLFHERMSWFDIVLLVAFGVAAAATKPILLPVILPAAVAGMLFHSLLRANTLYEALSALGGSMRQADRKKVGLVITAVALSIFCVYTAFSDRGTFAHAKDGIDGSQQLVHLLGNPVQVFGLLAAEVLKFLSPTMFDSPLGWLDTPVGPSSRKLHSYLLYSCVAVDLVYLVARWRQRRTCDWGRAAAAALQRTTIWWVVFILVGLTVFLSAILNAVAMYLAWTPVGLNEVRGLQYRYFIPQAILIVGLLSSVSLFLDSGQSAREAVTVSGVGAWQRPLGLALSAGLAVFLMKYAVCIVVDLAQRYW